MPNKTDNETKQSPENESAGEIAGTYSMAIELVKTAAKAVGKSISSRAQKSGTTASIVEEAVKEEGGWVEKNTCATLKVLAVGGASAPFSTYAAAQGVAAGMPFGPGGMMAGAVLASVATKPAIAELTKPVGEATGKLCHAGFDWMREKLGSAELEKQQENVAQPVQANMTKPSDVSNNQEFPVVANTAILLPEFPEEQAFYRGTTEDFSTVHESGFTPRGRDTNIWRHAHSKSKSSLGRSAYIATSDSMSAAVAFPTYLPENVTTTYVYELHPTSPYVDIAEELLKQGRIKVEDRNFLRYEQERAFTSKIWPSEIKGGWQIENQRILKVSPQAVSNLLKMGYSQNMVNMVCYDHVPISIGEFIPNPNYKPEGLPAWKAASTIGVTLTCIGASLDGYNLYSAYQQSKEFGDPSHIAHEATRIAAAWTGAVTLGGLCVEIALYGASLTAPGRIATLSTVLYNGFIGSGLGYSLGCEVSPLLAGRGRHDEPFQVKSEETIRTSQLTCNVKTLDDGTRIGKCVINTSTPAAQNQNNTSSSKTSVHETSKISPSTSITNPASLHSDPVDVYLAMRNNAIQGIESSISNPQTSHIEPGISDRQLQVAGNTARTSTSSLLSSMGIFQSSNNQGANFNNRDIVDSCLQNIESVRSAQAACKAEIAKSAMDINLSQFSSTARPTYFFTPDMNRDIARANAPFMHADFIDPPPPPSVPSYVAEFFHNGGERGGLTWVCHGSKCGWEMAGGNIGHGSNFGTCELGGKPC